MLPATAGRTLFRLISIARFATTTALLAREEALAQGMGGTMAWSWTLAVGWPWHCRSLVFTLAHCLTAAWLPLPMSLPVSLPRRLGHCMPLLLVRSSNSHVECLSKEVSQPGRTGQRRGSVYMTGRNEDATTSH